MEITDSCNEITYSPGHPWYYRLGGIVPTLKDIRSTVQARRYEGCKKEYIDQAASKAEPQRSSALRAMREEALSDLRSDLSAYRKYALVLHRFRRSGRDPSEQGSICDNVFLSLSLIYNHLYNDFAHLLRIDELLAEQLDLFGF